MKITVKKSDRVGYTPGCWRISPQLAGKICWQYLGHGVPSVGCEKRVLQQAGVVRSEHGVEFPAKFNAYVINWGGTFRLSDENGILEVKEV